jgi:hypothetical protein
MIMLTQEEKCVVLDGHPENRTNRGHHDQATDQSYDEQNRNYHPHPPDISRIGIRAVIDRRHNIPTGPTGNKNHWTAYSYQ